MAIAGRSGRVAIKTASGDITAGALAEGSSTAASGDITVDTAAGRLEVRTGSGDVRIGRASGTVEATSGSGDLDVGVFDGDTVTLKSGSGDLSVGLPRDVPIWQDVHSVTGDVSVTLAPCRSARRRPAVHHRPGEYRLRRHHPPQRLLIRATVGAPRVAVGAHEEGAPAPPS